MSKEILAKVYHNISKGLDTHYYKNCKHGVCKKYLGMSHTNCKLFFDEAHNINYRIYEIALYTLYPELREYPIYDEHEVEIGTGDRLEDAQNALDKPRSLILNIKPFLDQFQEQLTLNSKEVSE